MKIDDGSLTLHIVSVVFSLAVAGLLISSCSAPSFTEDFPKGWARDDLDARAYAPRPFGPEQIRDSMPTGAYREFTIESGGDSMRRVLFVEASDLESGTIRELRVSDDGEYVATTAATTPWSELAAHASFPIATTVCEPVSITVPAGRFDGARYEVRRQDGSLEEYFFARELPGPPIRLVTHTSSGETFVMELIAYDDTPTGPLQRAVDRVRSEPATTKDDDGER